MLCLPFQQSLLSQIFLDAVQLCWVELSCFDFPFLDSNPQTHVTEIIRLRTQKQKVRTFQTTDFLNNFQATIYWQYCTFGRVQTIWHLKKTIFFLAYMSFTTLTKSPSVGRCLKDNAHHTVLNNVLIAPSYLRKDPLILGSSRCNSQFTVCHVSLFPLSISCLCRLDAGSDLLPFVPLSTLAPTQSSTAFFQDLFGLGPSVFCSPTFP